MIIEAKSYAGNFNFAIKAEVSEEQRDALAVMGLLQVYQRSPVGAAEKALAYPGEKVKRPKDFDRKSIPFNEANAKVFKDILEKAEVKLVEDGEPLVVEVEVSEHEAGAGAETSGKRDASAAYGFLMGGLIDKPTFLKVLEKVETGYGEKGKAVAEEYRKKLA